MLGVDPGFASTGMAVIERNELNVWVCRKLRLVASKKATQKESTNLRVSADDARRLLMVSEALADLVADYAISAIGVEVYSPQQGRMGGNAWKTAMTYGVVHGFANARGIPVYCFLPLDLKKSFGMRLSASKGDVATGIAERVLSFAAALAEFPRGKQEHLSDASGHAVLTLQELTRVRHLTGIDHASV